MTHVYLLVHTADNNDWTQVYRTRKKAMQDLKAIVKEYRDDDYKLDQIAPDHFENDRDGVYLILQKTELKG